MRRFSIFLALCGAAACSADTDDLEDKRDAGVVVRDAGEAPRDGGELPRDGGTRDAGPERDAGPARTLVEFSLLGDSPPDNLVMNPNLTALSTVGPFAQRADSTTRHFARTPTRQPVLELAPNDSAVLIVQAEPGLTTASVWMGVRGSEDVDGTALLLGLARDQLDAFVQLFPTEERMTIGDISWQRFEGSTMAQLIGANLMFFENATQSPLFVTGPVVLARQARVVGDLSTSNVRLTPKQRRSAEALVAKYRETLMQDMKPVTLPEHLRVDVLRPAAPRPDQASGSSDR